MAAHLFEHVVVVSLNVKEQVVTTKDGSTEHDLATVSDLNGCSSSNNSNIEKKESSPETQEATDTIHRGELASTTTEDNITRKMNNNNKEREEKAEGEDTTVTPYVEYRFPPCIEGGGRDVPQNEINENQEFVKYQMKKKLRQKEEEFERMVVQFSFPDINSFRSTKSHKWKLKAETFSFVLTDSLGSKKWGYCQRVLSNSVPKCFCVISSLACFSIFSQLLREMINLYKSGGSFAMCTLLLASVHKLPIPEPGSSLSIRIPNFIELGGRVNSSGSLSPNQSPPPANGGGNKAKRRSKTASDAGGGARVMTFHRPNDSESLLDHVDFEVILHHLDAEVIVAAFASLLLERRLIFVANTLSTLSACVQAFVAVLYPFCWQHIFIPVLPPSLLSFCCAPMPFVIGVLRSCVPALKKQSAAMEEVVVVDIDCNTLLSPPDIHDDDLLPGLLKVDLCLTLDAACKKVKSHYRPGWTSLRARKRKYIMPKEDQQDLANAFIAFFVDLLCGYRKWMTIQSTNEEEAGDPSNKKGASSKQGVVEVVDVNVSTTQSGQQVPKVHFDIEGFIQDKPKGHQRFLSLLAHSQMFAMFIEERSKKWATYNEVLGKFDSRVKTTEARQAFMKKSQLSLFDLGELSKEKEKKRQQRFTPLPTRTRGNSAHLSKHRASSPAVPVNKGESAVQSLVSPRKQPVSAPKKPSSPRAPTSSSGGSDKEVESDSSDIPPYATTTRASLSPRVGVRFKTEPIKGVWNKSVSDDSSLLRCNYNQQHDASTDIGETEWSLDSNNENNNNNNNNNNTNNKDKGTKDKHKSKKKKAKKTKGGQPHTKGSKTKKPKTPRQHQQTDSQQQQQSPSKKKNSSKITAAPQQQHKVVNITIHVNEPPPTTDERQIEHETNDNDNTSTIEQLVNIKNNNHIDDILERDQEEESSQGPNLSLYHETELQREDAEGRAEPCDFEGASPSGSTYSLYGVVEQVFNELNNEEEEKFARQIVARLHTRQRNRNSTGMQWVHMRRFNTVDGDAKYNSTGTNSAIVSTRPRRIIGLRNSSSSISDRHSV